MRPAHVEAEKSIKNVAVNEVIFHSKRSVLLTSQPKTGFFRHSPAQFIFK